MWHGGVQQAGCWISDLEIAGSIINGRSAVCSDPKKVVHTRLTDGLTENAGLDNDRWVLPESVHCCNGDIQHCNTEEVHSTYMIKSKGCLNWVELIELNCVNFAQGVFTYFINL